MVVSSASILIPASLRRDILVENPVNGDRIMDWWLATNIVDIKFWYLDSQPRLISCNSLDVASNNLSLKPDPFTGLPSQDAAG